MGGQGVDKECRETSFLRALGEVNLFLFIIMSVVVYVNRIDEKNERKEEKLVGNVVVALSQPASLASLLRRANKLRKKKNLNSVCNQRKIMETIFALIAITFAAPLAAALSRPPTSTPASGRCRTAAASRCSLRVPGRNPPALLDDVRPPLHHQFCQFLVANDHALFASSFTPLKGQSY